jgi:hypothetical protein
MPSCLASALLLCYRQLWNNECVRVPNFSYIIMCLYYGYTMLLPTIKIDSIKNVMIQILLHGHLINRNCIIILVYYFVGFFLTFSQ